MQIGETQYILFIIMSHFNYCPLVWHLFGEVNTKKIEEIQVKCPQYIETTILAMILCLVNGARPQLILLYNLIIHYNTS